MIIRKLRQRKFAGTRFSASKHRTMVAQEQMPQDGTIELDLPHQGNRFVAPIATKRHAPLVATLIGMAIAEWRNLGRQISLALASNHRNRQAIENDPYRGEYKLISKNDDNLPIPH